MKSTPTDYDAIARDYQRTKSSPVRAAIESYTLKYLLGDGHGLAILDAGCGDGFHARRLVAAGVGRVAGIDVSPAMIELAREQERAAPLGILYLCCAVEDLPDLFCSGNFDAVLASYLLHYAPTVEVLGRMCQRISDALTPAGWLVALTENPDQQPADYAGYAPYGFDKQALEPRRDGSRIGYGLVSGRQIIRLETYWYSRETYQAALEAAGFRAIQWTPLKLDPEVASPEFYAAYLRNPPVLGLIAQKSRHGSRQGSGP
ncbi:MAG: class I SAM-dependent methyltransferase [Gammaproteobacteria bacterium]